MLKADWIDPTIITSAIADDVCRTHIDNIRIVNEPLHLSEGFI